MKRKNSQKQLSYRQLRALNHLMSNVIQSLKEDCRLYEEQLYSIQRFLAFKELEEEYAYFCRHAREVSFPDLPFPVLMLPDHDTDDEDNS